jgi:hypothetical protein
VHEQHLPREDPKKTEGEGDGDREADKELNVSWKKLHEKINLELRRALRRKPTRRSTIYDEFVELHVDRQILKLSTQRNSAKLTPSALRREATEFSRQLALRMATKGRTKLAPRKRSVLFSDPVIEDIFFSDSDPRAIAARAASPVRIASGGFLSFIHKTIQENIIAAATIESIAEATTYSMLSVDELLFRSWKAENTKQVLKQKDHSEGKSKQYMSVTELRQFEEVALTFLEEICRSPLGSIPLEDQSAVRDFICDRLLDRPARIGYFCVVAVLVISCPSLHGDDEMLGGRLALIKTNLKSIVEGKVGVRALCVCQPSLLQKNQPASPFFLVTFDDEKISYEHTDGIEKDIK